MYFEKQIVDYCLIHAWHHCLQDCVLPKNLVVGAIEAFYNQRANKDKDKQEKVHKAVDFVQYLQCVVLGTPVATLPADTELGQSFLAGTLCTLETSDKAADTMSWLCQPTSENRRVAGFIFQPAYKKQHWTAMVFYRGNWFHCDSTEDSPECLTFARFKDLVKDVFFWYPVYADDAEKVIQRKEKFLELFAEEKSSDVPSNMSEDDTQVLPKKRAEADVSDGVLQENKADVDFPLPKKTKTSNKKVIDD